MLICIYFSCSTSVKLCFSSFSSGFLSTSAIILKQCSFLSGKFLSSVQCYYWSKFLRNTILTSYLSSRVRKNNDNQQGHTFSYFKVIPIAKKFKFKDLKIFGLNCFNYFLFPCGQSVGIGYLFIYLSIYFFVLGI